MLSWKSFWNTNWHLQAFFSYSYFNPHFFSLNHLDLLLLVSPFFSSPPPYPLQITIYMEFGQFSYWNDCSPQILLIYYLYFCTLIVKSRDILISSYFIYLNREWTPGPHEPLLCRHRASQIRLADRASTMQTKPTLCRPYLRYAVNEPPPYSIAFFLNLGFFELFIDCHE